MIFDDPNIPGGDAPAAPGDAPATPGAPTDKPTGDQG